MFEDLIQDREVVKDLTRLSRKQNCGIGSSGGGVSTADLGALPDDLEHLQNEQLCFGGKVSGDDQGTRTEDGSEAADAVGARRGSPVTCCCGDNRGFNVRDTQRDDMTGIVVANGGRFPCLHIGVTGLRHNHRYFLALDFVEVGGIVDAFSLPDLTEPYYTPRPNNLQGYQWTSGVLYFNLNSIANGGLQENGMTLKVGGEYEPTLRLLELRDDQWPSGSSAVRFALRGTAFLVVSLNSEVRMNRTALASEFLLVRKSEMSRSRFPAQPPQPPPQPQQECCRSPPSRIFPPEPAGGVAPALQSEWRRLLELRAGGHPAVSAAAAAAATRLLRAAGPSSHGLQALPATPEPLAPIGTASALRPVYAKSVVHDHFSGGVWKSLPSQPQQSHHQPQPQQQPPQPVGAGAWHASSARHHSCSAPGAHLELGALLHGVQQNREALSSLVQHGGSSQSRPPSSLSDFGGRPGGGLQLSAEPRPPTSLAPFGGAAAAAATAHALQECWSRGSPPSGPPLLRFNYDLLPSGYLHWLALARSNLARPQAMAAAFDHAQQLQQQLQQQQQQRQSKQDMGVQTTCSTAPSSLEEADSSASDAMGAAAFAAPHSGIFFASSSSPASSP